MTIASTDNNGKRIFPLVRFYYDTSMNASKDLHNINYNDIEDLLRKESDCLKAVAYEDYLNFNYNTTFKLNEASDLYKSAIWLTNKFCESVLKQSFRSVSRGWFYSEIFACWFHDSDENLFFRAVGKPKNIFCQEVNNKEPFTVVH